MDATRSPHATVLSPDLDTATVDATRWLVNELRGDGMTVEDTARVAAEHLTQIVGMYQPEPVSPDHDPTDAELEQSWNAPDAPAAHKAAWALHQAKESREIEASLERENDRFARNNGRTAS